MKKKIKIVAIITLLISSVVFVDKWYKENTVKSFVKDIYNVDVKITDKDSAPLANSEVTYYVSTKSAPEINFIVETMPVDDYEYSSAATGGKEYRGKQITDNYKSTLAYAEKLKKLEPFKAEIRELGFIEFENFYDYADVDEYEPEQYEPDNTSGYSGWKVYAPEYMTNDETVGDNLESFYKLYKIIESSGVNLEYVSIVNTETNKEIKVYTSSMTFIDGLDEYKSEFIALDPYYADKVK